MPREVSFCTGRGHRDWKAETEQVQETRARVARGGQQGTEDPVHREGRVGEGEKELRGGAITWRERARLVI